MSWKDKARQAKGNNDKPEFLDLIEKRMQTKNIDGKPALRWYDSVAQENKSMSTKFKAVMLGYGMRLSGFSRDIGRNGGSLNSSVFYGYENKGVVFGGGKVLFKGRINECAQYIQSETGELKKKAVIFLYTNGKIIEVETNLSITISLTRGLNTVDNFIVVEPKKYNPDDFDAKTNKFLGSLAKTNPPTYLSMKEYDAIPEDWADENNLEYYFDKYIEFKEYVVKSGDTQDESAFVKEATQEEMIDAAFEEKKKQVEVLNDAIDVPMPTESDVPNDDPTDDLPF